MNIKNKIIKRLGGYTKSEFEAAIKTDNRPLLKAEEYEIKTLCKAFQVSEEEYKGCERMFKRIFADTFSQDLFELNAFEILELPTILPDGQSGIEIKAKLKVCVKKGE